MSKDQEERFASIKWLGIALRFLAASPSRFFLIVATTIGLILVFLIPPFQAPDEHTHFYKAVHMSQGHVKGQILPDRAGAYLPVRYRQTVDHYRYMYLDHNQKLDVGTLKHDLKEPITDNHRVPTMFENTVVYPPLPFIPQSIAVFLTNLFIKSVLIQMYTARLAVLASWLLLMYFAIKILPFGKWVAVALGLTPQATFLTASVSNDASMFGLCMLFIAFALRTITAPGLLKRSDIVPLLLCALALALCKAPYFLLVGLVFAIPFRRFKIRKHYFYVTFGIAGLTLLAAVLWQLFVRDTVINVFPGSDNAGQVKYILTHPLQTAQVIIGTLFFHPIGDSLFSEIVGLKAWVDAFTPLWLVLLAYGTIGLLLLRDPLAAKLKWAYERRARYIAATVAIIGVLAICLLLYITFTPVGKREIIVGLQGRYFIPFVFLAIPIFGYVKRFKPLSKNQLHIALIALLIVAVSVLPMTIGRYYSM